MIEVVCRRQAMATWFECVLVGADAEHLVAVGESALDEVVRLEATLSRYAPTAELSRVNREAADRAVRISWDLLRALEACAIGHELTDGWFDPCFGGPLPFREAVRLDPVARTVRFAHPAVRIDLGGYGKGYAIDALVGELRRFSIGDFLAHGGTSSLHACGRRADGEPWRIDLRTPGSARSRTIALDGVSLSCSAGAVWNPHDRVLCTEPAGVAVWAASAAAAEIGSTALLAMGRERAARFAVDARARLGWQAAAWLTETSFEMLGEEADE